MVLPDGEGKIWGTSKVRLAPWYLQSLKLRWALKDLETVCGQAQGCAWQGKVLDVGCGGGGFAKALKFYRPDLEIFGSDVSEEAIKTANRNSQGVIFKTAAAERLPFEAEYFDAITVFDLLEHLSDPEKALTEIRRVLKPGGIFILFAPLENQPFTLYRFLGKLGWRGKEKYAGHIRKFSADSFRRLLTENGFAISKTRFSFHCLGQFLDICFYLFLASQMKTGFEEHLGKKGNWFLKLGKNIFVALANIEDFFLFWLPGGGIQVTCTR